jgi:hypothetical protein
MTILLDVNKSFIVKLQMEQLTNRGCQWLSGKDAGRPGGMIGAGLANMDGCFEHNFLDGPFGISNARQ